MISLALNNSPGGHLLRIVPVSEDNKTWEVFIFRGPWDEDERGKNAINHFKTTEPMVMAQKDLVQFAEEIRRKILEKPVEDQKLKLTFLENLPQFEVGVAFIKNHEGKRPTYYRPEMESKFSFVPSINLKFSTFQSGREDDQYLYEGGGLHTGMVQYYSSEELLKFAEELEKEAKKSN